MERALVSRPFGPSSLQAPIVAVHPDAKSSATPLSSDWGSTLSLPREPSPVVELNRAAAIAMRTGPPLVWHGRYLSNEGVSATFAGTFGPVHLHRDWDARQEPSSTACLLSQRSRTALPGARLAELWGSTRRYRLWHDRRF